MITVETSFGTRTVEVRSNGRVDLLDESASPPRWVDWIGEVDVIEEWEIEFDARGTQSVRFLGRTWIARDRAGREISSTVGLSSRREALVAVVFAHLFRERFRSIREGRNPAVVHRAERIVERCNRRER